MLKYNYIILGMSMEKNISHYEMFCIIIGLISVVNRPVLVPGIF